jgi:hypothetical protein
MVDFASRQEKNRSNTEVLRGFLTQYRRESGRFIGANIYDALH